MSEAIPQFSIRLRPHTDLAPRLSASLEKLRRQIEEGLSVTYTAHNRDLPNPSIRAALALRLPPLDAEHPQEREALEEIRRQAENELSSLSYHDPSVRQRGPLVIRLHLPAALSKASREALEDLRRQTESELNRLRFQL